MVKEEWLEHACSLKSRDVLEGEPKRIRSENRKKKELSIFPARNKINNCILEAGPQEERLATTRAGKNDSQSTGTIPCSRKENSVLQTPIFFLSFLTK